MDVLSALLAGAGIGFIVWAVYVLLRRALGRPAPNNGRWFYLIVSAALVVLFLGADVAKTYNLQVVSPQSVGAASPVASQAEPAASLVDDGTAGSESFDGLPPSGAEPADAISPQPGYCEDLRWADRLLQDSLPEVPWNQLSPASKKHYRQLQRAAATAQQQVLTMLKAGTKRDRSLAEAWALYIEPGARITQAQREWMSPRLQSLYESCGLRTY